MRKLAESELAALAIGAGLLAGWTSFCLGRMGADPVSHLHQFGSFWSAGWAANHGLNPYGDYPLVPPSFVPGLMPADAGTDPGDINLNPPALLLLFRLLALADPLRALAPWVWGSAALFVLITCYLLRHSVLPVPAWRILCILLMVPVRDTIWRAQIYALVLVCAALGWVALKQRRDVVAGLAIGVLVAMKPNFAYWPIYLLLARRRRVALIAAVTVAVLALLPTISEGVGVYAAWLGVVRLDRHWLFTTDISLVGMFHRVGMLAVGQILAGLLAVLGGILVYRRRPEAIEASALALGMGIVAAPLAWSYYTVVLIPALVDDCWGPLTRVAAALLMVPVAVPLTAMLGPPWLQFLATLIPALPVWFVLAHAASAHREAPEMSP
ncbi:MAG TPA: glycosyltransferase family 87 protein [Acetobacteraceae bacterium]|nr:glycosyltransferase family 87 protein [Acetobacteraceae bacterium]